MAEYIIKTEDKRFYLKVVILLTIVIAGFINKTLNLNQYFSESKKTSTTISRSAD